MDFQRYLQEKGTVLFDGAMGTQLARLGLEMGGSNNLTNPEQVLQVHRDYCQAGADVLITNTLTMNRIYIESHCLGVSVREVNSAGVRLAKAAAREGQQVFGNISTTGQLLEPLGSYTTKQFFENFLEQAVILADCGVDGYIVETMVDLQEAACALQACKAAAKLPVIVSMSFAQAVNGGRTIMGNTVAQIASQLQELGADTIGANCGELDPFEMAVIAGLFREAASLPVIIQPNAGKPIFKNNQTTFTMEPEDFADGLEICLQNGACMVGGCCGTSPAHIRAIAQRIK